MREPPGDDEASRESGRDGSIPRGRLHRVGLLTGLAGGMAADLAGAAARLVAGGREDASEQLHRRAAQTLAKTLGRMKGLPMKLGQILSYVDGCVPPERKSLYRDALRQLQVKARPMRWREIEVVIEEDLKKKPCELFARFEKEPIAAASIGQVYRAALADGTEVAVKVQYPGIADAIRADIKNIEMLKDGLGLFLPKLEVERTLTDLTERVLEECDYGAELEHQMEFARLWAGDADVAIPRPYPELSSRRVLTTEFIEGADWHGMLGTAGEAERSRLGRVMYRFALRSLHVFGLFNGDPHPGNYLYPRSGKVVFLDFGCVQRYPPEARRALRRMREVLAAHVQGSAPAGAARAAIQEAYGMPDDLDEEEWAFTERYVTLCFEPLIRDGTFRFDEAFTAKVVKTSFEGPKIAARKVLHKGLWEPRREGLIFLHRIQFGLNSLLAAMGAEANWYQLAREVDEEAGRCGV